MNDQWLREQLKARDRAVRPNDHFSALLYARLADELRLRPTNDGKDRPSVLSIKRWLPAVVMALLTVGTVAAIAFLARPDDDALACTPELAQGAAQRLRESAGYTYRLDGSLATAHTPAEVIAIVGEVAADAARERYLSGGAHALGGPRDYELTDEAIQVSDTLWLRNYIGADPGRPWMAVRLMNLQVEAPNLAAQTADRLPRMIEGPAGAPPAAWGVVDAEVGPPDATLCTLRDERRWSDTSEALRAVTLSVDLDTGLPITLSETWQGFGSGGGPGNPDRQFDVSVAYPDEPPTIAPPPADQVSPNLDQADPAEYFGEAGQTITAPGEVTINNADGPYAKVTITQVIERRAYEGLTAMPGNVYLSFYSRHESLRDGPDMWIPATDWQVYAHRPGSPPSTPVYSLQTHIIGFPQPSLNNTPDARAVGDVVEGWLTFEAPADGEVSMWFFPHVASPARVILRQEGPPDAQESPAADCGPELIDDVRTALEDVPGYTYDVTGTLSPFFEDAGIALAIDGAFAAPSSVHERYDGQRSIALTVGEGKRVGDEAWWLPLVVGEGEEIPSSGWIQGAPPKYYVELPNVISLPPNPAVFALEGLVAQAPAFSWAVNLSQAGTCELVGRHVWSERNDAEQMLIVAVDTGTRLPISIRNMLTGFTRVGESRDWNIVHTFDYGSVPTIEAPAPDEVRPTPDFGDWTPGPRQIIDREGSATFEGLRVTASDVAEVRDYEGSTPMPGNVYLEVKLRYEALEGTRPVVGAGDWLPQIEGFAPGGGPPPPYHVDGGPELLRSDLRFSAGDVMEGWVVLEVPATGQVTLYGFGGGYADARVEIRLR